MKLMKMDLENFRGIKKMSLEFNGCDCDIYGANGTGKTTIANAISWLLYGQAATGEKGFTPKTTGAHNLHHVVTAQFQKDDGELLTLSKDFYEIWKKKRGSSSPTFSGHTTDYEVNGVPSSENQYNGIIEDSIGGSNDIAKMLTMVDYFPDTMSPDDRRQVLFEVCGDISDEEVIAKTKELKELNKYLAIPGTDGQKYSIEEYRKIATERRRTLNHDLDILPERIDEVKKSIPDDLPDESMTKAEIESLQKKADAVDREISEIRSADESGMAALNNIQTLRVTIQQKKADYLSRINKKKSDALSIVTGMRDAVNKIQVSINTKQMQIDDKNKDKERLMTQRELLLQDFSRVQEEQWDEGSEICPTCGRKLPEDKIEELRKEFNLSKSKKKEQINQRGQSCSQSKINELDDEINNLAAEIEELKQQLVPAKEKYDIQSKVHMEFQEFEETEEYNNLNSEMIALTKDKEKATNATDSIINEKLETKKQFTDQIQELQSSIVRIRDSERANARIRELNEEKRTKAEQLEDTEKGLFLCDEFTRSKVRMITDNINSKFHLVRFKLFHDQLNGGLKECCEPMVQNSAGQWVEYRSANTASQINAGIDIIGVLSSHYNIHLPVFIDRAESVTVIDAPHGDGNMQLIKLIVSPQDKKLRIAVA